MNKSFYLYLASAVFGPARTHFSAEGQPNTTPVIWSAPTNEWPSSVWVYKVVPQTFPPAVISNALQMASFTMLDKTNIPGWPPPTGNDMFFRTKDNRRYLGVIPSLALI